MRIEKMKIRTIILTVLALVSAGMSAQDNVIDEEIWIVGDEAILRS